MSPLTEQILKTVEILPTEDQQQILDFVEFIQAKRQKTPPPPSIDGEPKSFFDVARMLIGAGEGPGDLSTNPTYMEGYGQ